MTRVEEDVSVWTAEFNKELEDDDCDNELVEAGEINFDRVGHQFSEEVFMPLLFKLVWEAAPPEGTNWKGILSAIMAIAQVVEHIEEATWVEQCYNFVIKFSTHAHPRVRYTVFHAVAQICSDQQEEDNLAFIDSGELLAGILKGMIDDNIRVVTNATSAFTAYGDEADMEVLEVFMPDILTKVTDHLKQTPSTELQVACLSAVNACAEAAEDFSKYYAILMPVLKDYASAGKSQQNLCGKAFECIAAVGQAVGKQIFKDDAAQVMQALTHLLQAEAAPDDTQRKSLQEAASSVAETLGKDFKPYVPALLPGIFKALDQKATEVDAPDTDQEDDDDINFFLHNDTVMGLRTAVIDEMEDAMELLKAFVSSLEDDFCEFMPATCTAIAPLLNFQLSRDIRSAAFQMFEALAKSARAAVDARRIDASVLQELTNEFLKTVLGAVRQDVSDVDEDGFNQNTLSKLKARAVGAAAVINGSGVGVLSKDTVRDISMIVAEVLGHMKCIEGESAETHARQGCKSPTAPDGDESDEDDPYESSPQSVRYSFADVVGAMMRMARDPFLEIAVSGFIEVIKQFIKKDAPEADRALAFYMADDLVDCLEEHSIKYWDLIMNHALEAMTDKSAVIRQYAIRAIGNGARQRQLQPMVRAVALRIHEILQKQGEKHRRRRVVSADAKQSFLVVEAAIGALGQLCKFHEAEFGTDAIVAWQLWLNGLPFKYDVEEGVKAHRLLLELVVQNHPFLTSPDKLPQVMTIFADVYKSKFSNKSLDMQIASAVIQVGEVPIKQLCNNIPEKQQKKIEQLLKEANSGALAKAGA
mmetsp:Transcript_156376/g.277471  ORF Transcript_156376/g.277471 Transcript_156376/m.277471 type:complete len:814 (+) Transcript_156376:3-2444(+)